MNYHRVLARIAAARRDPEAGMSLVEVMVAMFVIGIVFTALAGLMMGSMTALRSGSNTTAANQIVNAKLEEARATPFTTIGTTWVGAPLTTTQTIDGVQYTVTRNVSRCYLAWTTSTSSAPPCVASPPTGRPMYSVSYTVQWPRTSGTGNTSVTSSTLVGSPISCTSDTTRPFSTPCSAVFTGNAVAGGDSVGLSGALSGGGIVAGGTVASSTLTLPRASSSIQSELTRTVSSRAEGPSISRVTTTGTSTTVGGVSVQSTQSNDPAVGSTATSASLSAPAISDNFTGSGLTVTSSYPNLTTGQAVAVQSAASSPACATREGTAITNGRPCAAANFSAGATTASTVQVSGSLSGVNVGMAVASIGQTSAATRTHSGLYPPNSGTFCTAAADPGCVAADLTTPVGASTIGDLPPALRPSGFSGAILVSSSTMTAAAERGQGAVAPATPSSVTIRYWNGTGYTTATSGATAGTGTVPDISVSSGAVTIQMTGISVGLGQSAGSTTNITPCSTTCSRGTSTAGGITASVSYSILQSGTPVAAFTATVALASAQANTAYVAAPTAGA